MRRPFIALLLGPAGPAMSQKRLLALAVCVLGAVGACCPAAAPPVRRVALVAVAYDAVPFDKRRDSDMAMWAPVHSYLHDSLPLADQLRRAGWDVRQLLSVRDADMGMPVVREYLPEKLPTDLKATEAHLRGYLKGLGRKGALGKEDEVLVVLTGQLVALETGGRGKAGRRYYYCSEDTSYPSLRGLRKTADVRPKHHLLALDEIYGYLRDCSARKKLLVLVTAPASGDRAEKYPPPLCRVLPKLPPPPGGGAL